MNDLFKKVASGEEVSIEEQLQVAKENIFQAKAGSTFEKMLSGEEVSIEEKISIARNLVADNVAEILQREMVVAHLSGEKTSISLKAKECKDSDENIRKYLTILGAKNVDVSSDFPCGRAGENYEGHTDIEFNY